MRSSNNPPWIRFLPDFIKVRIEGRDTLLKAAGNTGWLIIDQVIRMGVGLIVGIWVARYLGPENFGLLSYATAFVALFSSIAALGLNDIAVRNLVRNPARKEEILGTTFYLKLASGLAVFVLTVAGIILVRPADPLVHWMVGIISFGAVFQAFDCIDFWFQSQVRMKYTVYAKNAAFLIVSVVKIVLIMRRAPLIAFAWAGLVEIAIGSMGMLLVYHADGHYIKDWRKSLFTAKELLRDSWPLIFSGVVSMIYLRIDQVMLGQMVGNEEVGVYSAAVRLAEVWYFIPMVIYPSILPGIIEARAISEELFYSHLQKFYNLMAFLAYAVALPVTFMAGWIVELLFGQAYARSAAMLAVLVWAGLFVNLGIARSSFLMAMNWTKIHFLTVLLGSVINVALNVLLIPRYGGMGAVIASCVAYWFAAHGACFFYKSLHKTGSMLTRAITYPRFW